MRGAHKGGFRPNFDFDFFTFLKFWVICFPTNEFKAQKTFYDENYIKTSYLIEKSEKIWNGT